MAKKLKELGEAKEYVLKMAKERDVRFIRLWFTDILGFLKSFDIAVDELERALEGGMGFDGSSIEGFACIVDIAVDELERALEGGDGV